MDMPTARAAAVAAKPSASSRAADSALAVTHLPVHFAGFHSVSRCRFSQSLALWLGFWHRGLNCLQSGKPSAGDRKLPFLIATRLKLESPVTYRKQRLGQFLIATFRTLFRFAVFTLSFVPCVFSSLLQRPDFLLRPNRFALAANYSPVTIGL